MNEYTFCCGNCTAVFSISSQYVCVGVGIVNKIEMYTGRDFQNILLFLAFDKDKFYFACLKSYISVENGSKQSEALEERYA